jgi:hypothetical protein
LLGASTPEAFNRFAETFFRAAVVDGEGNAAQKKALLRRI